MKKCGSSTVNIPFSIFTFIAMCAVSVPAAPDGNMIGQMTQNEGMVAVPRVKPVVIDGDLGEWDLSGEIWSFADYELREQFSVKTAAMWDEDFVYLSFRWKDPTPLNSTVDPDFDPAHGWRADAIECRIDAGGQPSWWTMWCFKNRANFRLDYWTNPNDCKNTTGNLYKGKPDDPALGDGIELAYRKLPTNDGFVQELKVPWKIVYKKDWRAKVGEAIKMGLQFKWGDVSGAGWPLHAYTDNMAPGETKKSFFWGAKHTWGEIKLVGESVKEKRTYVMQVLKPKGTIAVRAEIPADATTFTIVIDDKNGTRVRNLVGGSSVAAYRLPRTASGARNDGTVVVEALWDGLDEFGNLVKPGEYTVRGLTHKGLTPKYVMSFYNPGTPPWSTPDGKGAWGSDHSRVEYAVASGENVVLASNFVEGGYGVWAIGPDGKKIWSEKRGVTKLAANDTYVFSVPNDWYTKEETLYRYDAKTGAYAPFVLNGEKRKMDLPIREILGVEKLKNFFPGEEDKPWVLGTGGSLKVLALAAGPKSVLIALAEGKVAEVCAETGTKIAEYKIDYDHVVLEKCASVNEGLTDRIFAPLAYDGKEIYFYKKGVLTKFNVADKTFTSIPANEKVDKPVSLALAKNGDVYVTDSGKDSQVKQFRLPRAAGGARNDGGAFASLVQTYGRKGGRPRVGKFDEQAMRDMSSATVDAAGNVWAVEFTDFPRRVSVWNTDGTLKRDYLGNTGYSGVGCFLHDSDVGRFFVGPNEFSYDEKAHTAKMERVLINPEPGLPTFAIDTGANQIGHIFHSSASGAKREYYFRMGRVYLNDNGAWRLVSAVARLGEVQGLFVGGYRSIVAKAPYGDFAGLNPYDILVWNDRNGNQLIERAECEIVPCELKYEIGNKHTGFRAMRYRLGWGQRMDPADLSFFVTQSGKHGGEPNGTRYRFKPASFAKDGAPVYTLAAREKLGVYPGVESLDMTPVPNEDTIVTFTKFGKKTVMMGLSKDGREKWFYRDPYDNVHGSHSAEMPRPGLLIGPLKITGFVRDCGDAGSVFMLRGNMGSDFYLTTDGLYVDSMFRDGRLPRPALPNTEAELRTMPLNMFSMGGEPFNGWIGRQDDGKVRMLCGFMGQASTLTTIEGLENLKRFTAPSIQVDAVALARADADNQTRAAEADVKPYEIARVAEMPKDWRAIKPMKIEADGQPVKGECRLAYNDTTLFAQFTVTDNSPWKNNGADKTRMFKTGDCVDLCLSPTANAKREVAEGDLRVVTSPFGNGSVSMLMRKVWKAAAANESVRYQSPVRMFDMAQVKEIGAPQVGRTANGHTVTLALAWKDLGITPKSGLRLRGDAGLILSDAAGEINTARIYYSNKNTNLVNDLPGEADLYPNFWIEFTLK